VRVGVVNRETATARGHEAAVAAAWSAAPAVLFILVMAVEVVAATGAYSAKHGVVLYPLDDSYIHLSVARTLATTGVWGVTPQHPAAASSSPLWSLALAAVMWLAPRLSLAAISWTPLVWNVAAALGLIALWHAILAGVRWRAIIVMILAAAVPLPAIAMVGMEHVLQALLATALAWVACGQLARDEPASAAELASLAALTALATATRYESLALVFAICVLAALRRKWTMIVAAVLAATAVVAGFGAIWVMAGGWPVPNSLLLKVNVASAHDFASEAASIWAQFKWNVTSFSGMLLAELTVVLLAMRIAIGRRRTREGDFAVLAALCTVAQLTFGLVMGLFRYEAWLVAMDTLAIVLAGRLLLQGRPKGFALVLAAVALACAPRAYASVVDTVEASPDRIWEHFGPVAALTPYAHAPVLVNDVGVISFLGPAIPVDLYGLADNRALRARRLGEMSSAGASRFAAAEGARVAEIQLCWADIMSRVPKGWTLVEVWRGPRNVVFGDLTVGFLADSPAQARSLQTVLNKAPIPPGVERFTSEAPEIMAFNATPDTTAAAGAICDWTARLPGRRMSGAP
jgi:hypothetical protein